MAQKGKLQIPFVLRPVGFLGDGQNRYVASVERYSTIGYKEIVAYAARAAHVPETDITMAMDALYDALSYFVCNGHGVKLPNLGIFTFGINAKATVQEGNAGADAVYRTKVNFLPVKELREVLDNVAITTVPMNPNGLTVGPGNDPRFKYVELNSKAWKGTMTFGYVYTIENDAKFTVRLSQIPASAPTMLLQGFDADGDSFLLENLEATTQRGASYVFDMKNVLNAGQKYELSTLQVMLGREELALFMFSNSRTNDAMPNGMSFMGKTVNEYPVAPAVSDFIVSPTAETDRVLLIYGANMDGSLDIIKEQLLFDDVEVANPDIILRSDYFIKVNVPVGVKKITLLTMGKEFNFTIAENQSGEAIPVITSLSANGVTVGNGGTSTIEVGKTYNFRFNGANLNLLKLDTISLGVPGVTKATVTSITPTAVDFTAENMQAGSIYVKDPNGVTIFSISVTAYTPTEASMVIDKINDVSNNGEVDIPLNIQTTFSIAGKNLTGLQASNFNIDGGRIVSVTDVTATAAKVTFVATKNGANLYCQNNGTVLFHLHLNDKDADVVEW